MNKMDVLILALILSACVLFFFPRTRTRLRRRRRLTRARKGEAEAIQFFEDQGYTIVDMQQKKTLVTWINGNPRYHNLMADFVVKKGGKTYIVEVKTGKQPPRPTSADTRRELLEYFLAYRPYGILVVDLQKKTMHTIAFSITGENEKRRFLYLLFLAGVLGLFCGWFLYKYVGGGMF